MRHRIHGCVHQDGGQQALAASVQQACKPAGWAQTQDGVKD